MGEEYAPPQQASAADAQPRKSPPSAGSFSLDTVRQHRDMTIPWGGLASIAVALTAAVLWSGCGGGEATTTTTPQLTGRDKVLAIVKDALTSPDAAHVCRDRITAGFVAEKFGGMERCESEEEPAEIVDATVARLSDGKATALVLTRGSGGSWQAGPGLVLSVKLLDGNWKLDGQAFGSQPDG
jgi:hypothetical protein